MLVKVCGITSATDVGEIKEKADMLGFIFHNPSPRNAFSTSTEFVKETGRNVETVGVFVDFPKEQLIDICRLRDIRTVQLHGKESPEECKRLRDSGFKVIKAFRIFGNMTGEDLSELTEKYEGMADLFLFDTGGKMAGGNGEKFNWQILEEYNGQTPYLVSGGISADDWKEILRMDKNPNFLGVDINSCFEISPGNKDTEAVLRFIEKVNG